MTFPQQSFFKANVNFDVIFDGLKKLNMVVFRVKFWAQVLQKKMHYKNLLKMYAIFFFIKF